MTQTFKDLGELSAALAFAAIDALKAEGVATHFGASNVSCSTYIEVGAGKIRFSDHADFRSGADLTIRIERVATAIWTVVTFRDEDDEEGETFECEEDSDLYEENRETRFFSGYRIDAADFAALVAEAVGEGRRLAADEEEDA